MKFSQALITLLAFSTVSNGQSSKAVRQRKAQDAKIVGGEQTGPNEFPYYVTDIRPGGNCGASLIAPQVILSAAHCTGLFNQGVRIGDHNLNDFDDGVTRSVVQEVRHPRYNRYTFENDIMVLKLDSPVTNIAPVPYTTTSTDPATGVDLTVMGFGSIFAGGPGSAQMLKVQVDSYSNTRCRQDYGGEFFEDIMFCAGVPQGGKDSCQGDSGGPIIDTSSGVQVGIVSWGYGCAEADSPGVYTRVGVYEDWIDQQLCNLVGECDGIVPEDEDEGFGSCRSRSGMPLFLKC